MSVKITITLITDRVISTQTFTKSPGERFVFTPPPRSDYEGYSIFTGGRVVKVDQPLDILVPAQDVVYNVQYQRPVTIPPPPGAAQPTPGGYEKTGDLTPMCEIVRKDFGGRYFWFFRNKYTGALSYGAESWPQISEAEARKIGCYDTPPQTLPDWQKSITDRIKNGFDQLGDFVSGLGKRVDAVQAGLDGIWAKLESWLVERLVGLMLRALDREVEAKK